MSLKAIPLAELNESALKRLVADVARESRSIDYKRDWRLNDDQDKREFLADVASFANSGGGDLVFGVAAKDGIPTEVCGLDSFNQEPEQLKIEQLVRSWIEPRLSGLAFVAVKLGSGKNVFVLRIPRSWSGPHMMTYSGYNRFFSRHSSGKYQLDVNELRTAFVESSGVRGRLRDFRLERISRIAAGEGEADLASRYCCVLHVLPISPFQQYDPAVIALLSSKGLRPMGEVSGWGEQINFDSSMIRSNTGEATAYSYVQLFREGQLEAVRCSIRGEEKKTISPGYEAEVRTAIPGYLNALAGLGIVPPFAVGLSFLNVKGFTIYEAPSTWHLNSVREITRDHIVVPEIVLESADIKAVDHVLKQCFDQVWNAFGRLRSPNFKENGEWLD